MRIQVNLSDSMVKKLDAMSEDYGVTRSALCAMLIGQGVDGINQARQIVSEISDSMKKEMVTDGQ